MQGNPRPLANLLQVAANTGGRAYGGAYSQLAGVSTASDGEGGFMATVKDGHGGCIGWYSGM
jgi:hypothetical protein